MKKYTTSIQELHEGAAEDQNLKKFKKEIEGELSRPIMGSLPFGDKKASTKPATLEDIIKNLEAVIERYKK
jgi:hypothetical protein